MKKYKIGYTQGVFDMFHIGHLNLLKQAKAECEYLIVGVNSDQLVQNYKHKQTVVKEEDRAEIVRSIIYVDQCEIVNSLDKVQQWKQFQFEAIFIGDDWRGDSRWNQTQIDLKKYNAEVVYLTYTKGISSTFLKDKEKDAVREVNDDEIE
ncbi:MAG: adenylyltransferase/cytidyltransferase family protein [Lachnospiraceae bacterium]|nr:adenylyltransferase/cytidyltransferase family protein [Lachnospiraceae bacterium]